jgi:Outer membrane protein beta-barrel domain
MKKIFILLIVGMISFNMSGQNSISFDAGYLRTHTAVSEYLGYDGISTLLDSVKLDPNIGSFQAALNVNIDLGRRFYLAAGFHYARKGMSDLEYSDTVTTYFVKPAQHYIGISLLVGYHYRFRKSKFGVFLATGPQVDFAVGLPNNGALYSGGYTKFFMPFSRYNEVDLSWAVEAGPSFKFGPGEIIVKVCYRYGLSDVLEDAFIIGRSSSFGISAGYSLKLGK